MSDVLDRTPATQAPQHVEQVVTDAVDSIVWDVLGAKGRKRAMAALEKRADRLERLASEVVGLKPYQRAENITPLWLPRLRGVDKALYAARQTREAAQKAAELITRAGVLRRIIGEVF